MIGKMTARIQYMLSAGIFAASPEFASQCVGCGKCDRICPQNISVMRELENARKYLEPFWVKTAVKVARRFVRVKK
jgi:hypothetical protein